MAQNSPKAPRLRTEKFVNNYLPHLVYNFLKGATGRRFV